MNIKDKIEKLKGIGVKCLSAESKNFFYDEPKEMMVSLDNEVFRTKIVIAEYNTKFMTDTLGLYEYAKEIPKPEQDEQFCLIKEFLEWKKNNENK